MTPVVNGLRNEFVDKLDLQTLNAGFGDGEKAFKHYGLPGHPSYLILDPEGGVIWRGFGPQSKETLAQAIEDAVNDVERSE